MEATADKTKLEIVIEPMDVQCSASGSGPWEGRDDDSPSAACGFTEWCEGPIAMQGAYLYCYVRNGGSLLPTSILFMVLRRVWARHHETETPIDHPIWGSQQKHSKIA